MNVSLCSHDDAFDSSFGGVNTSHRDVLQVAEARAQRDEDNAALVAAPLTLSEVEVQMSDSPIAMRHVQIDESNRTAKHQLTSRQKQ